MLGQKINDIRNKMGQLIQRLPPDSFLEVEAKFGFFTDKFNSEVPYIHYDRQ